jgi:hypothetical protein
MRDPGMNAGIDLAGGDGSGVPAVAQAAQPAAEAGHGIIGQAPAADEAQERRG